jgi:hypothetical protein
MPSIKIRDGRTGGNRMSLTSLSSESIVLAIGAAVEAAENGNDVDMTINADHIEVFVNAEPVAE